MITLISKIGTLTKNIIRLDKFSSKGPKKDHYVFLIVICMDSSYFNYFYSSSLSVPLNEYAY